mmetsp:Transcript_27255/g.50246  ORF Transcript_27255/g.50246 Transcript_27255/m.50246 type:complete len:459 (+) Transcript_27255:280-1656(+)
MIHRLVLLTLTLTSAVSGLGTDLLEILLEGSEILTGLGELTLLHTLTDVPVDEGTLGVHEIELVVEATEDLTNGSAVGDHADGALDLGKITTGDDGGGLVVDTALEASRAPVDELNGTLGLDGGNRGVDILGDDITTVHQAAGHVLAVTGVALDHHGSGLEGGVGDLSDGELLVVSLLGRDDGSVGGKHEMDTGVGHQVGLELSDIDVEGTIETEGGSEGGDNLSNETVQVGVGGTLNVEGTTADIVDGLVIKHNGDIGVLKERVGGKDGVVGLNNGGRDLGRGVDGETELGLLAVVNGEALKEERAETGTGTTTDGVEDKETLETRAVVGKLTDAVKGKVNNLLTDGVVATGEVVGGILLTGDQLLRVEELPVGTLANLVNDGGLKIKEDAAGNVLAGTSLGEEGVEGIIATTDGLVRGHLAIGLDTVLKAVELPAGITNLDTGLADVNTDNFTHVF